MSKQPLTTEYLIDYWLSKYHNTTAAQVAKDHPCLVKSPKWFLKYPTTQQQHDEWYDWAITTIMKHYRVSRKAAIRSFAFEYLNTAPYITPSDNDI